MYRAGEEGSGSQAPSHSVTQLCRSAGFLRQSLGLWSELNSCCPLGRENSLGYSTAHMLFVSGDASVPHSGQVFEASGHLGRLRALSKSGQTIVSLPKCRAFSCDHSFLDKW